MTCNWCWSKNGTCSGGNNCAHTQTHIYTQRTYQINQTYDDNLGNAYDINFFSFNDMIKKCSHFNTFHKAIISCKIFLQHKMWWFHNLINNCPHYSRRFVIFLHLCGLHNPIMIFFACSIKKVYRQFRKCYDILCLGFK
jgi:hypothetical protein